MPEVRVTLDISIVSTSAAQSASVREVVALHEPVPAVSTRFALAPAAKVIPDRSIKRSTPFIAPLS